LVSQFYHFSTFFYIFLKSSWKRKRKIFNSIGPQSNPAARQHRETGERPRAPARVLAVLQKSPRWSKECAKNPRPLFNVSLTAYTRVPGIPFLLQMSPRPRRAQRSRLPRFIPAMARDDCSSRLSGRLYRPKTASEHTPIWPEYPENGRSTCTAETEHGSTSSRQTMVDQSKRTPPWASQVCKGTRTTQGLDSDLPE
jgi:hypothetical protein